MPQRESHPEGWLLLFISKAADTLQFFRNGRYATINPAVITVYHVDAAINFHGTRLNQINVVALEKQLFFT